MSAASSIYLDYAAATPLDQSVFKLMQPYLSQAFFNPSATYLAATAVRKDIEAARARVAYWLGAKPNEIVFTAGGSEANNLAIHGVMRSYPKAKVLFSAIEHESVIAPSERYKHAKINVHPDGRLDLKDLEDKVDSSTVLVSVMYANNEVGTIEPIRETAKLIEKVRKQRKNGLPLYLYTDACQAANYLDLHTARLGVDLMTINGGKIYGPKQSGALYVKGGIKLEPLIDGGGQEKGLRSGTENVAGIIGLAAAVDIAQTMRREEDQRLRGLRNEFIKLLEKDIPGVEINGSLNHRLPNNVHITLPGADNERLIFGLDELGIQVAAGSACSASNEEASHVLKAMGKTEVEARASLRLTLGRPSSRADIEKVAAALAKLSQ